MGFPFLSNPVRRSSPACTSRSASATAISPYWGTDTRLDVLELGPGLEPLTFVTVEPELLLLPPLPLLR